MNKNLATNNTVDGMNIFNCESKFQNATQSSNRYKVWPDDLVQQ